MMRYNEHVDGIRSLSTMEMVLGKIGRGEPIRAHGMASGSEVTRSEFFRKPRILVGRYVPDEEHVNICLNCKKKKCTGSCSLVSRTTTGKKRKAKEG